MSAMCRHLRGDLGFMFSGEATQRLSAMGLRGQRSSLPLVFDCVQ